SGLRPSEALAISRSQLDMSGAVWVYRPRKHKGNWRGLERAVRLGPRAVEVLRPLLKVDPEAALISPRDAMLAIRDRRREARKTRPTKQTRDRDRAAARLLPPASAFYAIDAYRKGI